MITNCTFSDNNAGSTGGGISNSSGDPIVSNCIFWNNTDDNGANMDESAQIHIFAGEVSVTFSLIQSLDTFEGFGNIDADPFFVDADGSDNIPGPEDDDLRLLPVSPCIDAGDNSAVPVGVTTDRDGNARFVDDPATLNTGQGNPPVDMGAYEFPG